MFLLTYHTMLRLGMSPARLKAFVLDLGNGPDVEQARAFLARLGLSMFLEEIGGRADDLDVEQTLRVLEDYKSLDVECAAMGLLLCKGIRERYPDWRHLADGDGGDENLKDYPIEENPELTIRSVVDNLMLYQEGWGVGRIKHSLTYSGGLSRSYVRTYAPARQYGFAGFSPYTRPDVIDVAEGDSVRGPDPLRRAGALRAEGGDRAAGRQGGDRPRHAGLPEAAIPARRHVGRCDAPASRPVGARLPPRVRAHVCLTPGSIPPRRPRAIASCSNGAARGPRTIPGATRGSSSRTSERREGGRARMATVLLTGRECPWRCAMCDLWTYTTVGDTPRGAIPAQVAAARVGRARCSRAPSPA